MKSVYKPGDRVEREPSSKKAFKDSGTITAADIRALKEALEKHHVAPDLSGLISDWKSYGAHIVSPAPYRKTRVRYINTTDIS